MITRTDAASNIGPSTTLASRQFAKGDKLELVIDITGGSSPTADGVGAYLFVIRRD